MNNACHYERVIEICEEDVKILKKALELDPENANEYNVGIAHQVSVINASKATIKAIKLLENASKPAADKKEAPKAKAKPKSEKIVSAPAPVEETPEPESYDFF